MFEEPSTPSYAKPPNDLAALRIKHLEQKVAMLETQNQELTVKLFGK